MKSLVLFACVLIIGSSNSTHPNEGVILANDITTCMTENNLTRTDFYGMEDIMANEHTKSENEESTKRFGCFIACVLRKQNLMKGSHIKEKEVLAKLNMYVEDNDGRMYKIVRKCMVEVRSITHQCDKSLSIYTCFARGMYEERERERQEREKHEKKVKAEEAVTETEQAE